MNIENIGPHGKIQGDPETEQAIRETLEKIKAYKTKYDLSPDAIDDIQYIAMAADAKTDREATKKEIEELWQRLPKERIN